MSAPIKRYTVFAYLDDDVAELDMHEEDDGTYVLHSDHLASHAFDEAVDRAAFEEEMKLEGFSDFRRLSRSIDDYLCGDISWFWSGWKMCAKSRAKRFGGAE